jgi:hypothetical protein
MRGPHLKGRDADRGGKRLADLDCLHVHFLTPAMEGWTQRAFPLTPCAAREETAGIACMPMSVENAAEAHLKGGNSSAQTRQKIDVAHSQHASKAAAKILFLLEWQHGSALRSRSPRTRESARHPVGIRVATFRPLPPYSC